MTNPIGPDTVNVCVNFRREERLLLGQLAHSEDRSVGQLIRRLIRKGLEAERPDLAARLTEIRRKAAQVAALGLGILAVGLASAGGLDLRRTSTRVPVVTRQARRA